MVNFMYPAGDGRLKTLNFVINNAAYLDAILTCGERVGDVAETVGFDNFTYFSTIFKKYTGVSPNQYCKK